MKTNKHTHTQYTHRDSSQKAHTFVINQKTWFSNKFPVTDKKKKKKETKKIFGGHSNVKEMIQFMFPTFANIKTSPSTK